MRVLVLLTLLISSWAMADPSSAILLRRKKTDEAPVAPSSDRYRVETNPSANSASKPENTDQGPGPVFDFADHSPVPEEKKPKPAPEKKPEVILENEAPHEEYRNEEILVEKERNLTDEIQSLILGGNFFEMIEYKMRLGENDVRKNQIEIAVAPGIIYNDSSSSYSFRDYTNFSPAILAQADLWLTPFFGLHANFTKSSNGSFSQLDGSQVKYDHQFLDWGLEFRRFFSESSIAPSLTFQIKMQEYQFLVATEATERVGFTSRGATVGLVAKIPQSPRYQTNYYLDWTPNISHREDETKLQLKSGKSVNGTRVGLGFGGEFVFSRSSVLFWKVYQTYEKNSFKGTANTADPKTSQTPSNISVDNSLLMFTFGYRWGN